MTQQFTTARPIILPAWQVRGILDGTVTQLWRAMKRQPESPGCLMSVPVGGLSYIWPHEQEPGVYVDYFCAFPWGKVGSRIWGRETFFVYASGDAAYRADYGPESFEGGAKGWRSSAAMPRRYSRITLEIEAVSALPVQDVTEEDAKAAGMAGWAKMYCSQRPEDELYARAYFELAWDRDNPRHPWSSNPYAWRLVVRRVES